ncbi:branched-chain amino acid ABC transporter permease [Neobacillus drentensis]|uniref:branched-chain amino acid ABC transporter permease n=1 Tax=Neobacillus drentensis TaxID=220684 RepID=UPI00285EAB67|nr:branched-chain amino acid ABC transporter permease [Neobacillus drentensis]MDR7238090.1 branched-chain amino acid transport system permease protein [Neobacillus drentensis]
MSEFFQSILNGIAVGSAYTLTGLGLTVIYSVYRILNLAHGELYMLGAFASYFSMTYLHVPFFVALLISLFVTGIIGMILERVVFRPLKNHSETDFLIVTIGLMFFISNLALFLFTPNIRSLNGPFGNSTFNFLGINISHQRMFIITVTIVLIVALHYFNYHTRTGKQMRAVSQDKHAAQLMGINVSKMGMIAFFIAAVLAAVAGTLMGDMQSISPAMGFAPLLMAMIVVIFGGLGSVVGAIVGGIVIGIIQSLSVTYFSSALSNILLYLILFLTLMVRPNGLFGRKSYE